MNRYHLIVCLLVTIAISAFLKPPILQADDGETEITTPEQAAEFASELANKKCKESFAKTPFAPDSYAAKLMGSRWYWGKIEPVGIHGYSAEVEFNADGSDPKVRVVLYTDQVFIRDTLEPEIRSQGEWQGIESNNPEEMKNMEEMGAK